MSEAESATPTTKTPEDHSIAIPKSGGFFERFGLLLLLVLLGCYLFFFASHEGLGNFSAPGFLDRISTPEQFRDITGWQNPARAASVLIVASLAFLIPLIGGHFNLAVGAQVAASGMICASAFSGKYWFEGRAVPLFGAILLGLLASLLIGAVSGLLVSRIKVNSLITTLGIAIVVQGWYDWYGQGIQISVESETFKNLFSSAVPGIQMPPAFLIALGVAFVVWFDSELLPYGRRLAAIGSNPNSAGLVGIRVERTTFISFLISSLLAGIAGIMQLASLGNASASTFPGGGVPFILPAIAAVFLGATTWKAGRFNVPGVVIAILLVKLSTQALVFAGIDSWIETVVNGTSLVVAVTVSTMLARKRTGI